MHKFSKEDEMFYTGCAIVDLKLAVPESKVYFQKKNYKNNFSPRKTPRPEQLTQC